MEELKEESKEQGVKFTPGPWVREGAFIYAEDRKGVNLWDDTPEGICNLNLISAAPCIYEALKELNKELDAYWNGNKSDQQIKRICDAQKKCSMALKKAEGKTE